MGPFSRGRRMSGHGLVEFAMDRRGARQVGAPPRIVGSTETTSSPTSSYVRVKIICLLPTYLSKVQLLIKKVCEDLCVFSIFIPPYYLLKWFGVPISSRKDMRG